jgi:predicted metal-dependent HD superfamily phosphohydrolase
MRATERNSYARGLQMTQTPVLEQLIFLDDAPAPPSRRAAATAAELAAEFPSVFVSFDRIRDNEAPHLRASEWTGTGFDFWSFDCAADDLVHGGGTLALLDDCAAGGLFPMEVLSRCQRLIGRRNSHSQTAPFERALRAHAKLHDVSKPLVRADYNHSLDVWQWTLRLDPQAPQALQLAALFHDIERLVSEPDARVEQHAADYQRFKDEHARAGAAMAGSVLAGAGIPAHVVERVATLVATHESPSADAEAATLNDADALSFFSLNSSGYADYFGPEQTRKKAAWTWRRLSPGARSRMARIRLRHDVVQILEDVKESRHGAFAAAD